MPLKGMPLTQQSSQTDVLVVGAGAAGTQMALELARYGVDFRVVDRLPQASTRSRAITVHARTLELLERIDPDLAARFLQTGIKCPGYVLHYVDADDKRHSIRPGLDFRRLDSRYPFLLLNGQSVTEGLIRDHLQSRLGCQPEWGLACTRVIPGKGHVTAHLEHEDQTSETVQCRYLVACDGASSGIREQLGLAREGSDYSGIVLQNLDVELLDFPDSREWVHYCMGPGHFLMVAQLPNGISRLLMSQPAEHADPEATPHAVFADILARHFDGVRFGRTDWHSRWQSQALLANRYRAGNVFLAGDAAHVHSTGGGQGMNCCMQDAHNLGWKLAMVLDGSCLSNLLDSYEAERQPIGAQVIAAASSIHDLFMAGRGHAPEQVVALQETGELADLVGRVSGLAYHYRQGDAADGLVAGDRAPNARLAVGGRLFDPVRHSGFILLAALLNGADPAPAQRLLARYESRHPNLLKGLLVQPAPAPYRAESGNPALYLVRPDGYLATMSHLGDTASLDGYLAEVVASEPESFDPTPETRLH